VACAFWRYGTVKDLEQLPDVHAELRAVVSACPLSPGFGQILERNPGPARIATTGLVQESFRVPLFGTTSACTGLGSPFVPEGKSVVSFHLGTTCFRAEPTAFKKEQDADSSDDEPDAEHAKEIKALAIRLGADATRLKFVPAPEPAPAARLPGCMQLKTATDKGTAVHRQTELDASVWKAATEYALQQRMGGSLFSCERIVVIVTGTLELLMGALKAPRLLFEFVRLLRKRLWALRSPTKAVGAVGVWACKECGARSTHRGIESFGFVMSPSVFSSF
jgi:hypothetical protein